MRVAKGGAVSRILEGTPLPRMFRARQDFPAEKIPPGDIARTVASQIARPEITERVRPGMRIAVTAGSRGVANVALITRAIVDELRARGAEPFILPSMGSHGGATAEGQREVLAGYGITEDSMGCPIDARMETEQIGVSALGRPVFCAKSALGADGIVVSCRVKPHNAFRGVYESGILKMMVVGMGKREGAESLHRDGMGRMAENLPASARVVFGRAPVLFALPCVENAYDQTMLIEAVPAERIFDREPELLRIAFANMPSILVEEADVLIVDEIGKNYSGTGVDPNIAGTFSTEFASGGLKVQRTCMLRLSPESHGNGLGTGLANVITKRLYDDLDGEMMYPNCLTSTVLKSAMIPMVVADDREAIQACLKTLNGAAPDSARVVRIANSLHVGEIMLSEAYYGDVVLGRWEGLRALGEPAPLEFDESGNLADGFAQGEDGRR
ncbi:DUF362 domain-containing protein [bacterium]|nr:DUF362 domain-containing protein [bacterium]